MNKLSVHISRRFTLIELLTVVVIIAILFAMLLPALSRAKYIAKTTVCMNQLKQIGIGYMTYAGEHDRYYPAMQQLTHNTDPTKIYLGRNNSMVCEWIGGRADGTRVSDRAYTQLLFPYFEEGSNENDKIPEVFACPLALKRPFISGSGGSSLWNYSVWPFSTSRGNLSSGVPTVGITHLMAEKGNYAQIRERSRPMMRRIGDTFTAKTAKNGVKNFTAFAGDWTAKKLGHAGIDPQYSGFAGSFGRIVAGNHFNPGSQSPSRGTGYDSMLWKGVWGSEQNYLANDGSGRQYRLGNPTGYSMNFNDFYIISGEWEDSYVPVDLVED